MKTIHVIFPPLTKDASANIHEKEPCVKEIVLMNIFPRGKLYMERLMPISELSAKTLLIKQRRLESWFVCRYGLNLYRGCGHNCLYCDGRAEKYNVAGEFGADIGVKTNAALLLEKELDQSRRRKRLPRGFVFFGGGVGDSYQPAEEKYGLARAALGIFLGHGYPVHVLTKSTLVLRDLDILLRINEAARAMVSMSFSSVDPVLSAFLEPGVRPPAERLAALAKIKSHGMPAGMFLMPVVAGLTDTREKIDESVAAAKNAGLDFVVFGGMTLKQGRQMDFFMKALSARFPEIASKYPVIYRGDKYGAAIPGYYKKINARFAEAARRFRMPVRIPRAFWEDMTDQADRLPVILDHIDYYMMLKGEKSGFGYAAYMLSRQNDLEQRLLTGDWNNIPGVNQRVRDNIAEIAATGTSALHEALAAEYSP